MFEVRGMWEDSGFGWEDHVHEEGHQRYCFGGKGGGGTNTVTQVQIPQWMQDAGQDNYNKASAISQQPYQAYGGNTVAPINGTMQNVANRVYGMQGQGAAQAGAALGQTAAEFGFRPGQVNANNQAMMTGAQTMTGMDRAAYTNPYTQQVVNTGLAALEDQRLKAITQTGEQATAAGAFGGSRHGIREAETNSLAARQAADFAANANLQGFNTATQMMQSDADRMLAAAQSNQSAWQNNNALNQQGQNLNAQLGLAGSQQRLAAAGQYGNLANLGQQMTGRELGLLDVVGQQQRSYEQQLLDSAQQRWTDAYNWNSGLTGLGIRQSSLGMAPYGQTTTQSTNGSPGNVMGQAAGGALAGASIAGALGMSSGMGAGLGAAAGALSDPKEKKGMQKVGVDEGSGLSVFAFRYKGDPNSGPKVLGLDAREVAKKYPEASVEIESGKGKRFGILFDQLPESAARIARGGQR